MDKIFIGWSGNQRLAKALGKVINDDGKYLAVVGGGIPTNMFVGEQVLGQINGCDLAILLVERKGKDISPNLMFEWGYLVSKISVKNINTILINMPKSELPSDVLGSWTVEKTLIREDDTDASTDTEPTPTEKAFVTEIYNDFLRNGNSEQSYDYFDIIDSWKNYFFHIRNNDNCSERELCTYIIFGCLAAYYYGDNEILKKTLDTIPSTGKLADVVYFAKAYVDVFLNSCNMIKPLSDDDFFDLVSVFQTTLKRTRKLSKKIDDFLDVLCYDIFGLACSLFSRNPELDEESKKRYIDLAKANLEKVLELLSNFEAQFKDNICIVRLIKAYIYNDICNIYKRIDGADDLYLKYLSLSVEEREQLFIAVKMQYPSNTFLIKKMEQEYMIAFSAQCQHIDDPISRGHNKKRIERKLKEWKNDHEILGAMIKRIEHNLDQIR